MTRMRQGVCAALSGCVGVAVWLSTGWACSPDLTRQVSPELVGKAFPAVRGTSLDDKPWTIPDDLLGLPENQGRPVLLLIGYKQNAQFDIDRWMVGLLQLRTPVSFYEVPTIEGMAAGVLGDAIDNGMRRGIPAENWGVVITVYREAGRITSFTGTRNGNNARVVLVGPGGVVAWFHDRGFSPQALFALDEAVRAMVPVGVAGVKGEGP